MLSTGAEQEATDQDSESDCLYLRILWPGMILGALLCFCLIAKWD